MLKIAWDKSYILPLPVNHRFPMSKYEVLPEQLLHEGTIETSNLFNPGPIDERWILLTHDAEYWAKLKSHSLTSQEARRTGFPISRALIDREVCIVNGTLKSTLFALQYGIAMNIAGGTHHAFTNKGEGYCLLNDIAIAANFLLHEGLVNQILVVDLDVHQGNGTAQIFRNDPRVFTFSMHGKSNFPLLKETSDLDIPLEDCIEDAAYLSILENELNKLLEVVNPDFIFFQSGVDILKTDKLGRLWISRDGCKQRDRIVLNLAKKNNIPLVASMGGGYSQDFRDIIEAHANTFRLAQEIFF
ncbi:MAG TPA: histone deacetylase [Chryseolinea sp.]|nr:histone deacetylase [Chryseolinea sp.]